MVDTPLSQGSSEWKRRNRRSHGFLLVLLASILLAGCGRGNSSVRHSDACRTRATRLYEERDFRGSIVAYEDLLRADPSQTDAYFQIALIEDRNLNNYLEAAYHYQRYLSSPNIDAGKADLARGFLENAKLQFAASVPNAGGQNSPEMVKLQSENAALHRQVDELKREIVHMRSKAFADKPRPSRTPPKPQITADAPPRKEPPASTTAHAKTWTVKRGDGIQAIAEKVYGSRSKWRDIVAANPKIKDPNRLVEGQVLVLP